jgi:hypothetical protein
LSTCSRISSAKITSRQALMSIGQWTRQTWAAWIAAVDRMRVGDHAQWWVGQRARLGKPLSPKTKRSYLRIARTFFRDCQYWEWIRAGSTPRERWPYPAASGHCKGRIPA